MVNVPLCVRVRAMLQCNNVRHELIASVCVNKSASLCITERYTGIYICSVNEDDSSMGSHLAVSHHLNTCSNQTNPSPMCRGVWGVFCQSISSPWLTARYVE